MPLSEAEYAEAQHIQLPGLVSCLFLRATGLLLLALFRSPVVSKQVFYQAVFLNQNKSMYRREGKCQICLR